MYKIKKQNEEHDEHFLISFISKLIFDILFAISFVYLFYYTVLLNNAEIK